MEYYHLTPDVDPMSSDSEAEEEEDDDPNWLMVTHKNNNYYSNNNIKTTPSTTSISLETTSQKKTNKEVIRRPKQPQASAANGISSSGSSGSSVPPPSPKRRHQNRLSRIWDGVIASSYYNVDGAVSEKTTSETTSEAASNETRMPSERSNVDEEDLVQRINELFNSIQQQHKQQQNHQQHHQQQEASPEATSHPPRPKTRTSNGGRGLRNLHAVSGYFNDWAKWLTSTSGSVVGSNSAEANPFPQQCNNGPDTGYRIDIHILYLVPLAMTDFL